MEGEPSASEGGQPWSSIYQCHDGCFFSIVCSSCALCEVAEFLDDPVVMDTPSAIDKFGCCGQLRSTFATCTVCLCGCCCKDWVQPCYLTHCAVRMSKKLNRDMSTLGPCGDHECCDANCNFMWPCTTFCTLCMIYGEMKKARAQSRKYASAPEGEPSIQMTFASDVTAAESMRIERE